MIIKYSNIIKSLHDNNIQCIYNEYKHCMCIFVIIIIVSYRLIFRLY